MTSKLRLLSIPIVIIYCVFYAICCTHNANNNGYGFDDGLLYGTFATNFFYHLKLGVASYSITRLLPSLVVFLGAKILNINLNQTLQVVDAFIIYNTVLISTSAWLWVLISKHAKFSNKIFWVGFITLFINPALACYYQWYPILTDLTAFFFAMLFLYAYVSNKLWIIWASIFLAAFSWPIVTLFALPLLLPKQIDTYKLTANFGSINLKEKLFAALAVLVFIFLIIYYNCFHVADVNSTMNMNYWEIYVTAYPVILLLGIASTILYIQYIVIKSRCLSVTLEYFKTTSQLKNINLFIYLVVVAFYLMVLLHLQSKYGQPGWTTGNFLISLVDEPITRPGVFILCHLSFWGGAVALFILLQRNIFKIALQNGYGLYVFFLLSLVLLMETESRQTIFNFPIIVFLICKSLEEYELDFKSVMCYLLLNSFIAFLYTEVLLNKITVFNDTINADGFMDQVSYIYISFCLVAALIVAKLTVVMKAETVNTIVERYNKIFTK